VVVTVTSLVLLIEVFAESDVCFARTEPPADAPDTKTTLESCAVASPPITEAVSEMNVLVIVTEAVSPRLIVAEAALKVSVSSNAAFAVGAPESKPKLRAVTTASAIRLKVIFDIFVLSFSRTKDVLRYGWRSELRLVMQCTCYCTTFFVASGYTTENVVQ